MDRELDAPAPARAIHRGDIFWVAADASRGSIPGVFNHSRIGTVVVCALSSNLHRASEPGVVLLDAGEGGLARQSVVIASQISSLYKHRLQDHIGRLSEARVDQIVAALRFLQASFYR